MASGKQILEIAQKHIGEKYILGSKAPVTNPNFTGPWDCAEFITWCVFQASGLLIGSRNGDAYTGYWAADAKTKCTIVPVEKAAGIAGSILLRKPIDPQGNTRMGHIVFTDGKGKTVEAMGQKYGVRQGEITGRTWDFGLLIKEIDYTSPNELSFALSGPVYNFSLETPAIENALVLKAKRALKAAGMHPGTMNNQYDANMQAAVFNYQLTKRLVADGILGDQTLKSLSII